MSGKPGAVQTAPSAALSLERERLTGASSSDVRVGDTFKFSIRVTPNIIDDIGVPRYVRRWRWVPADGSPEIDPLCGTLASCDFTIPGPGAMRVTARVNNAISHAESALIPGPVSLGVAGPTWGIRGHRATFLPRPQPSAARVQVAGWAWQSDGGSMVWLCGTADTCTMTLAQSGTMRLWAWVDGIWVPAAARRVDVGDESLACTNAALAPRLPRGGPLARHVSAAVQTDADCAEDPPAAGPWIAPDSNEVVIDAMCPPRKRGCLKPLTAAQRALVDSALARARADTGAPKECRAARARVVDGFRRNILFAGDSIIPDDREHSMNTWVRNRHDRRVFTVHIDEDFLEQVRTGSRDQLELTRLLLHEGMHLVRNASGTFFDHLEEGPVYTTFPFTLVNPGAMACITPALTP